MASLESFHRRLSGPGPLGSVERGMLAALQPAAWLYGCIGRARETLYRNAIFSSHRAGVPVISVGNLAVGGTGKTPTVDYLVKFLLGEGRRVAVVSRGYGVRVQGVKVACAGTGPQLSAAECGDEPYLLARRNPEAIVLVAPRRRDGVKMAEERFGAEAIVLDDGFQHMAVCRDLNIVLLDARRPLGNGRVLPAGVLREFPSALERSDLVLLTRCPDPLPADPAGIDSPVMHSRHQLADTAVSLEGETIPLSLLRGKRGIAFGGIADPRGFFAELASAGLILAGEIPFGDHIQYRSQEMERLSRAAEEADYLITTEKDAVKLAGSRFPVPCYQVPLQLRILEEETFQRRIRAVLEKGFIP